jgi:uncharacterized protein YlxW (UPF0749 family)
VQTIRRLETEQAELKRTVGLLREELDARQRQTGASTELLEDLHRELRAQKKLAGLTDLRGAGLEILLDDSDRPSSGNVGDHLVHAYDLRDVLSLLWLGGAEAIAVNRERIVNSTSVYCVGSTVLVNDTRLSPPYRVRVVGNQQQMTKLLENPGYLSELKNRRDRVGVQFDVARSQEVAVPAYKGSLPLRYAKPGS